MHCNCNLSESWTTDLNFYNSRDVDREPISYVPLERYGWPHAVFMGRIGVDFTGHEDSVL